MRDRSTARRAHAWLGGWAAAIALAGCQQTVVFEQPGVDGGGQDVGGTGVPDALGFCSNGQTAPQMLFVGIESIDVIIALDRSSFMNAPFGSSTALDAAEQALSDMVKTYQNVVQFGSILFPGSTLGCSDSNGCCVTQEPSFPTIMGYSGFIKTDLTFCDDPAHACADTAARPTAAVLDASQRFFATNQVSDPSRYVLLVTNGPPGCAGNGGVSACQDAVNAVSRLNNNNSFVNTALVGLNYPSTDNCLGQMAQRAGNQFMNPYYVSNPTDLSSALTSIGNVIAKNACHLNVGVAVNDFNAHVIVWQNGAPVPQNDSNNDGWTVDKNNPYQINLHGNACDALIKQGKAGSGTLVYNCVPPHP
jgi:hypothetical protein